MGVRPFFRWPSSWSFRNCNQAVEQFGSKCERCTRSVSAQVAAQLGVKEPQGAQASVTITACNSSAGHAAVCEPGTATSQRMASIPRTWFRSLMGGRPASVSPRPAGDVNGGWQVGQKGSLDAGSEAGHAGAEWHAMAQPTGSQRAAV